MEFTLLTFDGYFATRLLEVLERAIVSRGSATITIEVVKNNDNNSKNRQCLVQTSLQYYLIYLFINCK